MKSIFTQHIYRYIIMYAIICMNLLDAQSSGVKVIVKQPCLTDCQALINQFCPDDTTTPLTITRDGFGIPTIKGGTLAQVARAVGQLHAQDRLWQLFLTIIAGNGRLAEFLGAGPGNVFITSDVFRRQINYTDAEIQNQINTYFTPNTLAVYTNYVLGINDVITQINLNPSLRPYEFNAAFISPIPLFTIYDILRADELILQRFSSSSIPSYQLDDLSDLQVLIGTQGLPAAFAIFNDLFPKSTQISTPFTIVPNSDCNPITSCQSTCIRSEQELSSEAAQQLQQLAAAAQEMSAKFAQIKEAHQSLGLPKLGSNGEAISGCKSASGNPMLRCGVQPGFDYPSTFYQARIDSPIAGIKAEYFTPPGIPFAPLGVLNDYAVTVQVGHLPTNDFLFESTANVDPAQTRNEIVLVAGGPNVPITIYRSTSGGFVIQNPASPGVMLTLRTVFIGLQLRAANAAVEPFFAKGIQGLQNSLLNPAYQSDLVPFAGDYIDTAGNFAAFHCGGWTDLPAPFDNRLPQGLPFNPAPSNAVYNINVIGRDPLLNCNNRQGYYVGWNTLFREDLPAAVDRSLNFVGLNRVYWIDEYLKSKAKFTFEDLKNVTVEAAVANGFSGFDPRMDYYADLFRPLFKQRFFQAVTANPTPTRLQALALLADYEGRWLDGDENAIVNGTDVSDKYILAQVWLLLVMDAVFNSTLAGTTMTVYQPTVPNPLPPYTGNLQQTGNLLSRILGTACDNTVFFPAWLASIPNIDLTIALALDQALILLGGFAAQPWGAGKRPIHDFTSLILGTVQTTPAYNAPGVNFVAELSSCGAIRIESIIPLGESGFSSGTPPGLPVFNIHNFDQQPFFRQMELQSLPPFDQIECALNTGICKKCGHLPAFGPAVCS